VWQFALELSGPLPALNAEDIRDGGPQGEATGRVITLRLPLHPLVALFSGCAGAEPAFFGD
jgi:hypothetical protein